MNNTPWTDAELQTVRDNYATMPRAQLGAMLGRSEEGIAKQGQKMGLKRMLPPPKKGPKRIKIRHRRVTAQRVGEFMAAAHDLFARPMGARLCEVAAHPMIGGTRCGANMLTQCTADGVLHMAGKAKMARYFLSAEAAANGAALIEVARVEVRKASIARKRLNERLRNAANRPPKVLKIKEPKPPKPVKAAKPPPAPKPPVLRKPGSNTGISHADTSKKGVAHMKECDMSKAKITIATTPPSRFAPDPNYARSFYLAGVGRDVETGKGWTA